MTELSFEELIRKIHEQKRKLYEKAMTFDAVLLEWDRYLDLYDYILKWGTIVNTITSLIWLDIAWTFNLPPVEVGIAIPIKIEIPPEVTIQCTYGVARYGMCSYETVVVTPTNIISYQKAIYGKSPYDMSYYDPYEWVNAMNQLMFYLLLQSFKHYTAHVEYPSIAEALETFKDIANNYANRVLMLFQLIINYPICGFVICGVTKLNPTKKVDGVDIAEFPFISSEFEIIQTDSASVFEQAMGFICGLTPCGLGRAVARGYKTYRPLLSTETSWWIDRRVLEQMANYMVNIGGRRRYEGKPFEFSRKVKLYAEKFTINYLVHTIVYRYVSKIIQDPIKINAYIRFALEYVFARVKKHKPSKRGLMYVPEKDYEEYIITKWKRMGLDETIMRKIIEMLRGLAHEVWNRLRMRIY